MQSSNRISAYKIQARIEAGEKTFRGLDVSDPIELETINGLHFSDCKVEFATMRIVEDCTFTDCQLEFGLDLQKIANTKFIRCNTGSSTLSGFGNGSAINECEIYRVFLDPTDNSKTQITGSRIIQFVMNYAPGDHSNAHIHLHRCQFSKIFFPKNFQGNIWDCEFDGLATAEKTTFSNASFSNVDLTLFKFNTETRFRSCQFDGVTMSRFQLSCMNNYGGLSPSQRSQSSQIKIICDVAELRMNFGGWLNTVHLMSLIAFLLPYAWFIVVKWISNTRWHGEATVDQEQKEELFWQFLKFIWHGKPSTVWAALPSISFYFFLVFLIYNAIRATLLWKTMKLEHEEHVLGVPANFSLVGKSKPNPDGGRIRQIRDSLAKHQWNFLFQIYRWGFYVSVLCAIGHTLCFLFTRVPV
jgi:uncharacterized protein YjbI with pentapeptide repeats